MFSAEEESRIEQVNGKRDEITLTIRSLSSAVQSPDEHCKNKEQYIEAKGSCRTSRRSKGSWLTSHRTDKMVLGESHGMNERERKEYILSTVKRLQHHMSGPIVSPIVSG